MHYVENVFEVKCEMYRASMIRQQNMHNRKKKNLKKKKDIIMLRHHHHHHTYLLENSFMYIQRLWKIHATYKIYIP